MLFVNLMVKLREVSDILRIRLQYIRRLQTLDAVLIDIRNLVLEEERIDTLVLIVRANGDQQETERIHLFGLQRLEQVIPTERQ